MPTVSPLFGYNVNLELNNLINQNGESYNFTYDAQGQLISETGIDGKWPAHKKQMSTPQQNRLGN